MTSGGRLSQRQRKALFFFGEVVLVGLAYFAYMLIKRFIESGGESQALAHGAQVVAFEKSLGIFWEPALQDWVARNSRIAIVFLNWAYIFTFFPIIITAAVFYYFKDRPRYHYYRGIVFFTFLFALIVFAAFPLAPPRFMDGIGIVDTIQQYGPSWYGNRNQTFYYNAYAAMPSLHFGWTVLFGVLFFRSKRRPYLKVVGIAYPALTLLAITATGNHYFIDAIGGAVVVLVSYAVHEVGEHKPLQRFLRPHSP